MIKSLMTFIVLTLVSLSVFAQEPLGLDLEPNVNSAAMFDWALKASAGKLDTQKAYIIAGIILYDNDFGKGSYKRWAETMVGTTWSNRRKLALAKLIEEWKDEGPDGLKTNYRAAIQACATRYSIVDKQTDMLKLGIKLGYITPPAER